jgi:hypothetical protein
MLDAWLKKNSMEVSKADSCLYIMRVENSEDFLAMAIYVDDLISVDNNPELRKKLVEDMQNFQVSGYRRS